MTIANEMPVCSESNCSVTFEFIIHKRKISCFTFLCIVLFMFYMYLEFIRRIGFRLEFEESCTQGLIQNKPKLGNWCSLFPHRKLCGIYETTYLRNQANHSDMMHLIKFNLLVWAYFKNIDIMIKTFQILQAFILPHSWQCCCFWL